MTPVTEIIIALLKPDTTPFPPNNMLQGRLGYTAVWFRRQIENLNRWVIFIDWDDISSLYALQQQTGQHQAYLEAISQLCADPAAPTIYHVALDPPLATPIAPEASQFGLLDAAPVVEVVRLCFLADLSEEAQRDILVRVEKSKREFFLPNATGHVGEPAFGFALEPAEFQGEKVSVLFALAGWESVEVWKAWAESEVAKTGIAEMKGLLGLKGQELFLVRRNHE